MPRSSCIRTDTFPAPSSPSAPRTISTSRWSIRRSKSIRSDSLRRTRLTEVELSTRASLFGGCVELRRRRRTARHAAGRGAPRPGTRLPPRTPACPASRSATRARAAVPSAPTSSRRATSHSDAAGSKARAAIRALRRYRSELPRTSPSANSCAHGRDDVVGDRVDRGVDGERVEAAGRPGHVEQGADPPVGHDAERRVGRVALRVEDDHGAVVPSEILAHACDQVGRLALFDGPDDRRVLPAQLRMDRHRPVGVREQTGRPAGPGGCLPGPARGESSSGRWGPRRRPAREAARGRRPPRPRRSPARSSAAGLPSPRSTRLRPHPPPATRAAGRPAGWARVRREAPRRPPRVAPGRWPTRRRSAQKNGPTGPGRSIRPARSRVQRSAVRRPRRHAEPGEAQRRGGQRDLDDRMTHRRLPSPGAAARPAAGRGRRLDPPDRCGEEPPLVQANDGAVGNQPGGHAAQAAVRIGRADRGGRLDLESTSGRRRASQASGLAGGADLVVDLERDRRLAGEDPPGPADSRPESGGRRAWRQGGRRRGGRFGMARPRAGVRPALAGSQAARRP